MDEKYSFFKNYYEYSLSNRDRIRSELLDMSKLNIVFYGLIFFFVTRGIDTAPSSITSQGLNWYTSLLLLLFALNVILSAFLAFGLLPASYRYLSGPEALRQHWAELEEYHEQYPSTEIAETLFKRNMIKQFTECAETNDKVNLRLSSLKFMVNINVVLALIASFGLVSIIFLGEL